MVAVLLCKGLANRTAADGSVQRVHKGGPVEKFEQEEWCKKCKAWVREKQTSEQCFSRLYTTGGGGGGGGGGLAAAPEAATMRRRGSSINGLP
ncbi:unnamed protein product [Ixodes pacificus]